MSGGQISATTFGPGDAGNLELSTGTLLLDRGGEIHSSSYGTGLAGDIILNASSIKLRHESGVRSETSVADGGNIVINARDILHLSDSQITTSVADADGNGGNLTIDPVFIILERSKLIANAHEGNGGDISLSTDYFFYDSQSVVEASSELGIDGTITIESPNIDLSPSFATLPEYHVIEELKDNRCESRQADSAGSLVEAGRGSLPEQPGDTLSENVVSSF